MDTVTHFAMGFGLAGLASLDPAVLSQPELAQAVWIGTVIGSQAPDFDGIMKLKGSAAYIKHHRGWSHSLPALLLWPLLISCVLVLFFDVSFVRLFLWTALAVGLHVFVDCFNSYGTQALRPFSRKWVAWNVINIFDPYIFGIHLIGFLLWMKGFHSGYVFLAVYLSITGYVLLKIRMRRKTVALVMQKSPYKGRVTVFPTLSFAQWGVIVETETHHCIGEVKHATLEWHDLLPKTTETPVVEAAKRDENAQAFLSFSRFPHVETREHPFGYEVRWCDLRFRIKNLYPFMSVVYLDNNLRILDSYTGWIYREDKLQRKLDIESV
ncbi:metal-dependent hydrolase [Bacillaceae bacterium]